MKINIAVNNYETKTIDIHSVDTKDIPYVKDWYGYERYIVEELGYSLSNIEWFIFDEIRYMGASK